MESQANQPCVNCQHLQTQVSVLQAEVDSLRRNLAQIQQQLAQARKDSSNSSKPPSSDLVKPPKATPPNDAAKRRRGGQPGHPLHLRPLLPPELLNGGSHFYPLELCPDCGQGLQAVATPARVVQQ